MNAFFAAIEQLDNPEYRGKIELCQRVVHDFWRAEGVFQVQVTALDPRPEKGQTELFGDEEDRFHRLNKVMEDVNNRYGEFTLTRATLMRCRAACCRLKTGHRRTGRVDFSTFTTGENHAPDHR